MRPAVVACAALLLLPMLPLPVAAQGSGSVCAPVGPCIPVQRQYDDLVANNLNAIKGANLGWINVDPGSFRYEPLLGFPSRFSERTFSYAGTVGGALQETVAAMLGETLTDANDTSTWVLGLGSDATAKAPGSVLAIANAGDAILVVTVSEAGGWVTLANAAGVALASAAVIAAQTAPAATGATVSRALDGVDDYVLRKTTEAATRVLDYLANPPMGAVERDVNENGLGDSWEDSVCRARLGAPALPPNACYAAGDAYRMARSFVTQDFDQDGLDLVDEYRWNSDPLDPDTDKDGLPDGPEADVWRRPENDLVVEANLWSCPTDPSFAGASSCAWRHPDSFRDDDEDGRFNIGQDPNGPLAALGAGDDDSENDGLGDGDEYYGCWTDPAHGPNNHRAADIPGFRTCGGSAQRGRASDPTAVDTDEDGLTDRQEVCSAAPGPCSRAASYGTNPQAPDTDGDGWNDGPEAGFWADHGGWWNDIDQDSILNNLADPDSDRDGIQDGVEVLPGTQTRPDLPDTDGDTMPDQWELRNNFNPRSAADGGTMDPVTRRCMNPSLTVDADSDGLCNAFEYGFQRPYGWVEAHQGEWNSVLNPRNSDLDGDRLLDGAEIFPEPVADYLWRYAQQQPAPSDPYAGKHFYKWDAAYPGYPGSTRIDLADTDGDGLTDAVEEQRATAHGTYTNPNSDDSDADGRKDALETQTDPTHWDTDRDGVGDGGESARCQQTTDCDQDGLPDGEEEANLCDPMNPDTDGDELLDGWEVKGTPETVNPNRWRSLCYLVNSDSDALPDGEEVLTYGTNPSAADTDGDSLTDFDEVHAMHAAGKTAHDLARGTYEFTMDHCTGSSACSVGGATDPLRRDSDGDGLGDGDELLGIALDPGCPAGVIGCAVWITNPNRKDTDGDSPANDNQLDDTFEAYLVRGVCHLNPADYDTDHDVLPDADELREGTKPCDRDTDGDLLTDGAELQGFASDPLKHDTDGDGITDFVDPNPFAENHPPILLGVKPLDGNWRTGICISAADENPIRLQITQTIVQPTYASPLTYIRREPNDVNPTWQGSNPPHLCVRYSALPPSPRAQETPYIDRFEVKVLDSLDNAITVRGRIEENPTDVSYIEVGMAVACWIPGVGDATQILYAAYQLQGMKVFSGGLNLAVETAGTLKVGGQAMEPAFRAFTSATRVLCALDTVNVLIDLGTTVVSSEWAVVANPVEADRFTVQGSPPRAVFLIEKGHQDSRPIGQGTDEATTTWRGQGYSYLAAKHPSIGSRSVWKTSLESVFSQANYESIWTSHGSILRADGTINGKTWSVYVLDGMVMDVDIV